MKKSLQENTEWREWQGYRYPVNHPLRSLYSLTPLLWPLASLLAPFAGNWFLSKLLRKYPGATGKVGRMRLGWTRMEATLSDVQLTNLALGNKLGINFSAGHLRIRLRGNALRQGILVCSIEAGDLYIGIHEYENESPETSGEMPPFLVEALSVDRGSVRVDLASAKAPLHVVADSIWLKGERISMLTSTDELPALIDARARIFDGSLKLQAKASFSPCAFDLNAQLEKANLVLLNDYLRSFGKVDVHGGEMSLYLEATGKDGKYKGYLKPILRNLDLVGPEDRNDSLLRKIWERIVAALFSLLKNRRNDQVATRIPFEGSYDMRINVFHVIGQALRNAFIEALKPGFDGIISFPSADDNKGNEAKNKQESGNAKVSP